MNPNFGGNQTTFAFGLPISVDSRQTDLGSSLLEGLELDVRVMDPEASSP